MRKDDIFDIDFFDDDTEPKSKKKPAKRPKLAKVHEELSMLSACDAIVDIMSDSGLSAVALKKAKPYLRYVAEKQQLTEMQAMFFALILNISLEGKTYVEDIAELLDCRNITILCYSNDIDELVSRHLVIRSNKDNASSYRVANDVIEAMKANKCYIKEHKTELTGAKFFYEVSVLFDMRSAKELTYQELVDELKQLMDDNPQVEFVRELRKMKIENDEHIMILTIFAAIYVVKDYTNVSLENLEDLIPESGGIREIKRSLSAGYHPLIVKELIKKGGSNGGLLFEATFQLTIPTMERLLAEFYVPVPSRFRQADIIRHDKIEMRPMFYNEKVRQHTERLMSLMSADNYDAICQRLREKKLSTGFTCLFYGSPGTGKTETALQIARQTGRDIMRVELSQLRDQYVGESEKQVKALFKRYAKIAQESSIVPILLFNEADGIINRRMEHVQHSVDKMENAIQNIILQELENFNGILIATTNLTSTLDPAFERRFLYKINFEKPDLSVRKSIWHAMIPELDESTVNTIASRYPFSGGQIRNVATKLSIDSILYGEASATPNSLNSYCLQEHISKEGHHIGF